MNLEKLWSIATRRHELEQLLVEHTAAAGRTRAALGRLEFLLIEQAAETDKMHAVLEDVYALACGPPGARTNDLKRKKFLSALKPKPEQREETARNCTSSPDLGEETKRALSNQENMIDD